MAIECFDVNDCPMPSYYPLFARNIGNTVVLVIEEEDLEFWNGFGMELQRRVIAFNSRNQICFDEEFDCDDYRDEDEDEDEDEEMDPSLLLFNEATKEIHVGGTKLKIL